MKIIRNIVLVLIVIALILFGIYIAPNYKKTGLEDRTNLVINYTNVTAKMSGKVIREGDEVYLSLEDIQRYYDDHVYLDEKYNVIVASNEKDYACFNIKNNTLELNGKVINKKVIKEDKLYYIPITCLQDMYNIEVKYSDKTDCVVIKSLDRDIKTATTSKNISVKSKPTFFSRTLEKVDSDSKIYIKINDESTENKKTSEPKGIKGMVKNFESKMSKGWIYVRTEDGTLGYVKSKDLKDEKVLEYKKPAVSNKKISLVWDYYHPEYGSAPKVGPDIKYDGVTVVSPACFFMNGSTVDENVGEAGEAYFSWAKENHYEVWPRLANDSITAEDMKTFSNWITDYQKRQAVIEQIVEYVDKYDLDGINLDFEHMYQEDVDSFSRFIIELKPRLAQKNAVLSVDVTAPDGGAVWSLCYDRAVIGKYADYIVFMAYDQTSKSASVPESNSAYYWVETNIKKFINNENVEPNKIILALPFYSYLWKTDADGKSVKAADTIKMSSQSKYVEKATTKEVLEHSKQTYIEYVGNDGYTYKMWVEDVDSISEKLDLVNQYDLAGVGFWQNGHEDKAVWNVVKKKILNK